MDFPTAKSQCKPKPTVFLPDELVTEILSLLPVKSLTRLRCVNKSWNTTISDPTFVKLHLNRSSRHPHLTLMWGRMYSRIGERTVVPFPVRRLMENPLITVPDDPCYRLNDQDCRWVIGSCNGLLCLRGYSLTMEYREHWICVWNPATRTRSEKLGVFRDFNIPPLGFFKFAFGYDGSTDTYKVVALLIKSRRTAEASWRNEVRVFSLGDNSWRIIQSFPVVPIQCTHPMMNNGVNLKGTLNWLALRNSSSYTYDFEDLTVEQFVIVSLDLRTETYREWLLPKGFDEVPQVEPTVGVLTGCLCLSYDVNGTDFAIWQMKELGVTGSWTPFVKIKYQNLPMNINDYEGMGYEPRLLPLCLSENGDTVILANEEEQAILYNWRDDRGERIRITNDIWWVYAKDYVESLVSF